MITEEQKQRHLASRTKKIQELAQAQNDLETLTTGQFRAQARFALKQQMQRQKQSTKIFDLQGHGNLEIQVIAGTLPGPLAFWQDETTVFLLLWDRALILRLPRHTGLAQAASYAGQLIPQAETPLSQQPFLVYLSFVQINDKPASH